jgi:hypothetical protein
MSGTRTGAHRRHRLRIVVAATKSMTTSGASGELGVEHQASAWVGRSQPASTGPGSGRVPVPVLAAAANEHGVRTMQLASTRRLGGRARGASSLGWGY